MKFFKRPLHKIFFYLLILFLPSQLGYHFWPSWSLVAGLRIDYLSPTIYLTDVLIFFIILFWILSCKVKVISYLKSVSISPYAFLKNKQLFISLFLIISFFLFTPFYLNPFAHFFKLVKIIEIFLFGFYVSRNLSQNQFKTIICLLSAGVFFESLLAIVQFVKQSSLGGIFYFFGERNFNSGTPGIAQAIINGKLILRPYGTFSHPNSLAGYFLVSLFLIIYCYSTLHYCQSRFDQEKNGIYKKYPSYFFIFVISFSLLTIFLTFSRSVWFIAGFTFFLVGLLNIKNFLNIIRKNTVLSIFLCLGFFSLSSLLFNPTLSRLSSLATTDSQSVEKRLDLNSLAWKMFVSSPLIGIGLNNFIPNIPKFTQIESQVRFYQPVHNVYLLILSETGLFGLSFSLGFLYKTIKLSLRASLRGVKQSPQLLSSPFILSSLFAILLLGLFDHYWLTLQQNLILDSIVFGFIFNKLVPIRAKHS